MRAHAVDLLFALGFAAAAVAVAPYLGSPFPPSIPRIAPFVLTMLAVVGICATGARALTPRIGWKRTQVWRWLQLGLAAAIAAGWLLWNLDLLGSAGQFG